MLAEIPSYGVSPEAKSIAVAAEKQRRQLRKSAALGNQAAFDELGDVWAECRHPGWDGYDARAVDQDTLRNAYVFLESLPLGVPAPSIGAEPDGDLALDWHRSVRRTLSVSVTRDGDLHYAALFGPNRVYGTEAFFGRIPETILSLIWRVYDE
jgi:hypothetical protein